MGKDAGSPPAPPDYVGAAKAQGDANLVAAQQSAVMSNPNVSTPYGSQSVTYGTPNGPSFVQPTPQVPQAPQAPSQGNPIFDGYGNLTGFEPSQGQPSTPQTQGPSYGSGLAGMYQPNITQTLNPQSQAIFNAQQGTKLGLANLSGSALNTAQGIMNSPFQYNGPGMQMSLPTAGKLNYGPSADQYGLASGNLDLSGIAKMPVNAGMTGQQAIMSRLQPQIERGDTAYAAQLANQGIGLGSQAYGTGMNIHNQANNDLLTQAALQGIGLDLSANQQGFNQALQRGQFGNQAIAQNFGQGATAAQLQNQAQNQQFNQGLSSAQFGNTAQQQALQQQLYQRELPLNEISALMSGSQIQNPQFQAYQGSQVAPSPLFNATQAQYGAGLQNYGAQNAQNNNFMNGLFGLGSAGLNAYGTYSGLAGLAGAGAGAAAGTGLSGLGMGALGYGALLL